VLDKAEYSSFESTLNSSIALFAERDLILTAAPAEWSQSSRLMIDGHHPDPVPVCHQPRPAAQPRVVFLRVELCFGLKTSRYTECHRRSTSVAAHQGNSSRLTRSSFSCPRACPRFILNSPTTTSQTAKICQVGFASCNLTVVIFSARDVLLLVAVGLVWLICCAEITLLQLWAYLSTAVEILIFENI